MHSILDIDKVGMVWTRLTKRW